MEKKIKISRFLLKLRNKSRKTKYSLPSPPQNIILLQIRKQHAESWRELLTILWQDKHTHAFHECLRSFRLKQNKGNFFLRIDVSLFWTMMSGSRELWVASKKRLAWALSRTLHSPAYLNTTYIFCEHSSATRLKAVHVWMGTTF